MDLGEWQSKYAAEKASLFGDGYLDQRFDQLQQREKYRNPNIMSDSFYMFFDECDVLLPALTQFITALDKKLLKKARAPFLQLKNRTSLLGAKKANEACLEFQKILVEENVEGCNYCFSNIESEIEELKEKLEPLLQLEKAIVEAGGKF